MQLAENIFQSVGENANETENNDQEQKTRLQALMDQDTDILILKCKEAVDDIKSWEGDRSKTNALMKAKREELEALGITKQAFALAVKVSKMDETQLDGFWLALQIMLKAVERPIRLDDVQMELFAESGADSCTGE